MPREPSLQAGIVPTCCFAHGNSLNEMLDLGQELADNGQEAQLHLNIRQVMNLEHILNTSIVKIISFFT